MHRQIHKTHIRQTQTDKQNDIQQALDKLKQTLKQRFGNAWKALYKCFLTLHDRHMHLHKATHAHTQTAIEKEMGYKIDTGHNCKPKL